MAWAGPVLAFVLLTALAQWSSQSLGGWVFVRTEFGAGAWWQLLSAQWVHLGLAHAAVNVGAMALIAFIFSAWVPRSAQYMAWLGGFAGVAMVLAADAQCVYYAGASGALHGYWAGAALVLGFWRSGDVLSRPTTGYFGGLLLLCLALKLGLQPALQRGAGGASPLAIMGGVTNGAIHLPVYYPAHAAGAAGGAVMVLLWMLWMSLRLSASRQRPA